MCPRLSAAGSTALRPHRRGGEAFGFDQQFVVGHPGGQALAPEHREHRHGERADPVEVHMIDLAARPFEHLGDPRDIGQTGAGVGPGGFDQQVTGLVLLQDVKDEVGRKSNLPARLSPKFPLARVLALDQAGYHRHLAEGAAQQIALLHPVDEFVRQNVGR